MHLPIDQKVPGSIRVMPWDFLLLLLSVFIIIIIIIIIIIKFAAY